MKWIKRIFWSLTLTLILFIGSAVSLAYIYAEEVEQILLSKLSEQLKEPVSYEKINFSLLKKFPYASVELKKVYAKGAGKQDDDLISIESIFLNFSWWEIFQKEISIQSIEFKQGVVSIVKLKDGSWNYEIFTLDTTAVEQNKPLNFNLENIRLNQVLVKFVDKQENLKLILLNNQSLIKLYIGDVVNVNFEVDGVIHAYESNDFTLSKMVPFKGKILSEITEDKIDFSCKEALLNKQKINFLGVVQEGYHVVFNVIGADLLSLIQLLPEEIKFVAFWDEAKGKVNLKGELSSLKGKDFLNVHYTINQVFLKLINDYPIHKGDFEGDFVIEKSEDLKTAFLTMDTKFSVSKSDFKGNIKVVDFTYPKINGNLNGVFDLKDYINTIPKGTFHYLDGLGKFGVSFSGAIKLADKQLDWIKVLEGFNTHGQFVFKGLNIQVDPKAEFYKDINADLSFKDKDIQINHLHGYVQSTRFELKGYVRNYLRSLLGEAALDIVADLKADKFLLEEFISMDDAQGGEVYQFELPSYLNLNLVLSLGFFGFEQFEAKQLVGKLSINKQHIYAKDFKAQVCGGEVDLYGHLGLTEQGKIDFDYKTSFKQLDLKELFKRTGNFGQDFLLDKHLKGKLSGSIDFLAQSDLDLTVDLDKVMVKSVIEVKNGELLNFEPLVELQAFLKSEFGFDFNFSELKFSSLNNVIGIMHQWIIIPEMEIKSSGINLNFMGKHSFDHAIDYLFKIKHAELIKARHKNQIDKKFGVIIDDGKSAVLPLRMYGNIDDPKFSYDIGAKKDAIIERIKVEKDDLKEVLKKERLMKDATYRDSVYKAEKNTKVKIQVDWDDDEE